MVAATAIIMAFPTAYRASPDPSNRLFTTDKNCPSWQHRGTWQHAGYATFCMNNAYLRRLVHRHCKHHPQKTIHYSDIGRLLILHEAGGWYVDSDVAPTALSKKLRSYPDTTFGLESDFSVQKGMQMGMLPKSLVLWTIYGVKGDVRLKDMACTLAHMAAEPQPNFESIQTYIFRTSGPTAQMRLWKGTVLPVEVFACGQEHSNSPPCSAATCWGCHHFKGRWL